MYCYFINREVLFRHGISPDQHTAKTSSPLYVASQKGRTKVVEGIVGD